MAVQDLSLITRIKHINVRLFVRSTYAFIEA